MPTVVEAVGYRCLNPDCNGPLTGRQRKWCSQKCRDVVREQCPERLAQKRGYMADYHKRDEVKDRQKVHMANYNAKKKKAPRQRQARDAAPAPKGIDADKLRSIVDRAHTDAQAADWLGRTPQHLRRLCKKHGLVPPSQRKKKQMAELHETLDLENEARQRLGIAPRHLAPTITRRCTAGCGRQVQKPGPCAICQKEAQHA